MRSAIGSASSLSVVLMAAIAAAAEPPALAAPVEIPTPEFVRLMMARDPAVQEELKLSTVQRSQVETAIREVDPSFWRLRDVPPLKSGPELRTLDSKLRARMGAVLSPSQQTRFEQLVTQARGARALTSSDFRQQLSLTDDQTRRLSQLVSAAEGRTLSGQKVLGVLNPSQQARLNELFGPRFDLARVSRIGCYAPELQAVEAWINSPQLSLDAHRGKVIVVHFWAFGCINCIRNLPHYQAWFEGFSTDELTIIGIHTPETDAERDVTRLREQVAERGIKYPVAFDLAGENWKAWANNLWPSVYLIDRQGQVRAWWYGELNWEGATGEQQMRKKIAALIAER